MTYERVSYPTDHPNSATTIILAIESKIENKTYQFTWDEEFFKGMPSIIFVGIPAYFRVKPRSIL